MISVLCLHIAKNQASYRYRVAQFLPYWKDYGIEMHPVAIVGMNYIEKLKLALASADHDYVWLQKKTLSPLLINMICRRSKLVYDFDDALYARQTGHHGRLKSSQPGSPQTVRRLNHILAEASLVFAGSPALEAYAMSFNRGHVHLVPTSLERAEHLADISINGRNNKVVVGWIGNSANLHYLELIDEATWQVQQKYPDVVFSLMSGKPAEHLKTLWTFTPWSAGTEQAWLRSIDIGIMPLADDAWSRGKCAFKLLQYMACAKPVIASPVGANVTTVSDGRNGYLPATTDGWINAFETLVPDSTARAAMGKESLNIFTRSFERRGVQGSIAELLKAGLR